MRSRSNPFEELERMFDRLGRQFDEAARGWEFDEEWWPSGRREAMAADLADAGDEFVITVDLPGFDQEDVTVEVSDHTLHVEAARDEESERGEEGTYLRRERTRQSLRRAIRLPEEVDTDDVTARLHNGVLTVSVAKTDPTTPPRQIDIEGE